MNQLKWFDENQGVKPLPPMCTDKLQSPIQSQATPFQRFTIRLVDGKFVRVPKADLPSVQPQVDKTLTSNQTEIRDLFRLVNGRFVPTKSDPVAPRVSPELSLPARHGPDPTFDLPE